MSLMQARSGLKRFYMLHDIRRFFSIFFLKHTGIFGWKITRMTTGVFHFFTIFKIQNA